ncbi:MAG: HAD hydrolase-like protein [Alphaproteobacteria bacterium]|nr:HAD hydrolase-like protein [Alphaproteobacteria bacterium]
MSRAYHTLSEAIAHTDFVILDNDGVNYAITDDIITAYSKAAARAGVELRPDLFSFDKAYDLVWKSWTEYHSATYLYTEQYGLDPAQVKSVYHKMCKEGIIPTNPELAQKFERFHLPHAMLTHGNPDWVRRVLGHLGLDQCFNGKQIYTSENIGFRKSDSPKPFELVVYREGYQRQRTMVVEDTLANLVRAKDAGMMTVLVTNGNNVDLETCPWVDYKVESLEMFLDIAAETLPAPKPMDMLTLSSRREMRKHLPRRAMSAAMSNALPL